MYYLQTRYYSPDWGRFISSDAEYGSTGQINTSNLFAYCMNNPVNGSDMKGQSWWLVVAIVVAIVVVTVVCVVTIQPEGLLADAALADAAATTTEAVADTAVEAAAETSAETAAEASSELADEASTLGDESLADDPAECDGENYCFIAGTPVMTSQGHVPIQNIKIGDMVYSENPDTGETALKKVLQTYIHETGELVHVTVNGTTITSTPTHKFYVPTKGWTEAAQLRAGDKLLLLNGEIVIIEMVQHEVLEKPVKVYNFEVEDFHTYFVSISDILVHNSCNSKSGYKAGDTTPRGRVLSEHGADSANTRGFDTDSIDRIMDNNDPYEQGNGRFRYQDARGNTVVTEADQNEVVTVYSHPYEANYGNYIPKGFSPEW